MSKIGQLVRNSTNEMELERRLRVGRGFLNTLIDKLPFEMHIPTYHVNGLPIGK